MCSNYTLLSATLSQESHYSHVLYPTLAVMSATYPAMTESLTVSFRRYLLVRIEVIAIYWHVAQTLSPRLPEITFTQVWTANFIRKLNGVPSEGKEARCLPLTEVVQMDGG